MRFKKIVFGLILSLLLAFPAYASEITPISVGDTRSQSDIILRASGGYDVTTTITLGPGQTSCYFGRNIYKFSQCYGTVTVYANAGTTVHYDFRPMDGSGTDAVLFVFADGANGYITSAHIDNGPTSETGITYSYKFDGKQQVHTYTLGSRDMQNRHNKGQAEYDSAGLWGMTTHKCQVVVKQNPATCKHTASSWQTNDTSHWQTCVNCGQQFNQGSHTPGADGNCTSCGEVCHTHSWSLSQGDSGYHWQVCSCGHTQNTAPHTWQFVSNSATCINPGVETTRCTVCGRTETETSQPLGHDKVFVRESEATCTEPAKKYYSCSRCHLTIIDEIGDPLGHDFQPKWYPVGQWQDVYWQDTCTRCGLVQGDRHYKEVPVNFITIDYHTKEELQRVTKLVTFDSIVRGDSLGTKNETFNGVEYRYHGATGLDNQLFARPDLDVYRYMVKHKYTIYFNPNGGEGEMTPITLTYGSRVTLPANTFTRTGYNFIGWSKTPTGSADYPDKYWSENDLRSQAEAGEKCDLYAIWEGKTVVVSFENGVGETPTPIRVTYDQPYGKLPTPTMDTGFRFKGWKYTEINNDTDEVIRQFSVTPDTIVTVADDHVLTADYAESAIKITFVAPSKVQVIYAISGYAVSPPFVPNEEGKNFIHWSLSEGGEAFDFNTPIEEDTTFYAVFESKQVTCTLVDYGVKKYYYPAKIGELPVPEQPGQRFVGWFWDEACKQPVSATESIPLNDFSLYPKFTEGNYILSLNTSAQKWEMKYGDTIPTLPIPKKGGATFKYWEYEGEQVKAGDIYKWSKDVQLIARWDGLKYVITFPNGTTKVVEDGNAIGSMPTPPDKVGMSFITYVDQDGIPVNSGTIPDRDLQLDYKYGYNQISLELIDDSYSQTVIREAGELLNDLPTRSKPGYTFLGWSQNPGGTTTIGPLYVNTKLYAVYSADYQDIYLEDLNRIIKRKTDDTVGALPDSHKDGFRFDYWTYNGKKVTSDTKVPAGGMTLVPHYTELNTDPTDTVEVRFWCDGIKINTIDLIRGNLIHNPGSPAISIVEPDRHFLYWTTSEGGTDRYEFEQYVDQDLDLYAKWSN